MKVNRIRIQPYVIRFIDNFNIQVYLKDELLYEINNGYYKFYDKITMIRFMRDCGIKCQCERKIINNRIKYFYFNNQLEPYQKEFLHKRALTLAQNYNMYSKDIIKHDCGCKNKTR